MRIIPDGETSAVLRRNFISDGESESDTFLLSGEERVENPGLQPQVNATARVFDFNAHHFSVAKRPQGEMPAARHRLQTVDDEVQ